MTRQIIIVAIFVCFVFISSALAGTWRDDFEDGNLKDWERVNQFWTVEKGECSGEFWDCCTNIIIGEDSWEDYTVKCKIKFVEDTGWAGMEFRYLSDPLCYTLFLARPANTAVCWKCSPGLPNGMTNLLNAPLPFIASKDTWHEIEIIVKGGNFEFYMDKELIGKAKDNDPFPSGKVDFIVSKTHAHFDDLIISGDGVENGGSWDPTKHPEEKKAVESEGKLAVKWSEIKSR